MKTKLLKALLGGITGTGLMTIVMYMAPLMGIPKMNAAEMLAVMMGSPMIVGWITHFMIGILFAAFYVFVLSKALVRIKSRLAKGAIFGMVIFLFAQLVMAMMGKCILCMTPDVRWGMLMGSVLGHLVYGIAVSLSVRDYVKDK